MRGRLTLRGQLRGAVLRVSGRVQGPRQARVSPLLHALSVRVSVKLMLLPWLLLPLELLLEPLEPLLLPIEPLLEPLETLLEPLHPLLQPLPLLQMIRWKWQSDAEKRGGRNDGRSEPRALQVWCWLQACDSRCGRWGASRSHSSQALSVSPRPRTSSTKPLCSSSISTLPQAAYRRVRLVMFHGERGPS